MLGGTSRDPAPLVGPALSLVTLLPELTEGSTLLPRSPGLPPEDMLSKPRVKSHHDILGLNTLNVKNLIVKFVFWIT